MTDISDFLKGVITECNILANRGRIVFNGDSFYCESPRLGRKFDIQKEDIQLLVDNGYAHYLFNGAIRFDAKKMDDIYYDLFTVEKIPNPKHERMMLDVHRFHYLLQ